MAVRALLLALALACLVPGPAAAQTLQSAVLIIDQERLLLESRFGRDLNARIEAAARELAAENRQIEAELTEEERDLTERRPTLPVDEFRALADAFDEKVQRIRAEQEEKSAELARTQEAGQQDLFRRIAPVLSGIVRDRGAVVLLDQRNVVLSADAIDITDEAIRRLDAMIVEPGGEMPPETPNTSAE